jgi:hypothetical protein
MRPRRTTIIVLALAAVALGWVAYLSQRPAEQTPTDAREVIGGTGERQAPPAASPAPGAADTPPPAGQEARPVDVQERARFSERARAFFAQAPGLPPEEARQQADEIARELSRIEQAGGLSAGETFLIRAGLIQATVADEQQRKEQIRALRERYETEAQRRSAQAPEQADPMFELYKVREGQIVAEVMAMETIPDGLSRDEYLRRRLQAEREQLLGEVR